ncbi:Multidrug resistance-associated protein 1 [Chytridiales sp. JEL 0842]|nr:Multidrug resistance-associated protein 1 [Chytridiales sp. JEL 0842]
MKNGMIEEMGTYEELIAARGEFSTLMQNYGGVNDEEEKSLDSETEKAEDEKGEKGFVVEDDSKKVVGVKKSGGGSGKGLMKAEDRATGALESSVFVAFAIAMGGVGSVGVLIFCLLLTQVTRVANDLWLVRWSSDPANGSNPQYMWTYFGLGMSQAVSLFIFSGLVAIAATKAAKNLQEHALRRIVRTPIRFFDTNPMGRIINRFSRDQDIVDNTLPNVIRMFSLTFGTAFGTFCLVAYATTGWIFVGLLPMLTVYYFVQDIYRSSARELKRLDALTRSPLYAHITESMAGVATIRAYGEQHRFLQKTDDLVDGNNTPYYLQVTGQRWLGMRLESIGNSLVFFTSLFAVLSAKTISPSLIGLALSYVLQVTQLLSLCIKQYTEAEVQLVSIERLHYYGKTIRTEAPPIMKENRPDQKWPSNGTVEFEDVSMRYQDDLPLVLRELTFSTRPNEKIGIVGRTGSGKSSLIMALFRMIEASAGRIVVDGVDINKIGLYDLRSRLSIIPQDPILFSGTIRSNLDPFDEHTDLEIWEALGASGMKEAVSEMEGVLEAPVTAAGDNLSVGQRQLMCLARALLRKPKLIVLDECTANVDFETDSKIQIALRENLKNATILTIAHRLNTIIDSDRVLVLDNGQILEFDTPAALMANDGTNGKLPSQFLMMINETGASNAAVLKGMVKKNV